MAYALQPAEFADWLDRYRQAWEQRDPDQAAALFTADATYAETPFDPPFEGRKAIAAYWAKAVAGQRDVTFTSEVLGCAGDEGVAHWHAAFTGVPGDAAIDLDGIFRCRFAGGGQVADFREWWHIRVAPAAGG